jgi:hypothetical protein
MSSLKNTLIILILISALGATLFLIYRTTNLNSRASSSPTATDFSQNSYLFASPLTARADGKEIIRLTAFILDPRGLGIPNILISLDKPAPLITINSSDTTNDTGQATFDLTSLQAGNYTLKAKINSIVLPQTVKITFY